MKIRKAQVGDKKGILEVIKNSSVLNPSDTHLKKLQEYIDFCLSDRNLLVLVAEEKFIIAVCILHIHSLRKTDAKIYDLYVLKNSRSKGIGKQIMSFVYKYLKKKGIKNLGLYSENNKKTLKFYKREGFQIGRLIRRCDKKI